MTQIQQQKAAKEFAERWKGKGYEQGLQTDSRRAELLCACG